MSFKERFLKAEASFLDAMASNPSAMATFDTEWQTLGAQFEDAMALSLIHPDDAEVAFAVSSRIAIHSNTLLELEQRSQTMTTEWLAEIDSALSQLTLKDVSSIPRPSRHLTQYVAEAFSWLLNNLHDPYPPSSLKRMWARKADLTTRGMDDWFKSIRKEIGWVALTKEHFNGSRSLTINAATSVLLDNGGNAEVSFEVQAELLAIKARLEGLFPEERGEEAIPSMGKSNKRARSISILSTTTNTPATPRSYSPSVLLNSPFDDTLAASSSPSSRGSSRPPSLVADQSDSDEDEKLPELPLPDFRHVSSIHTAGLAQDDAVSERRLKRTRFVLSIVACRWFC